LWEIGSGAKWLAYHVATSVALHQLFRGLRIDHVPTFVVYDQPSQVYFPRHVGPDRSETSGDAGSDEGTTDSDSAGEARFRDEDVTQVRKVFQVLSDAVRTAEGKWQAIILDHAGGDVWGGVPGVHSVEDWHSGETLVPREWLQ
jgi:hypothetical protein